MDLSKPLPVNMIPPEVCVVFKTVKSYRILDQFSFGPVRRLPDHMLALIPSRPIHLQKHLETMTVFNPTQSTQVSIEPTPEEANPSVSGPKKTKKSAKRKTSPSKPKDKKKSKVSSSSQQEGTHDIQADSGLPNTPPIHSSKVPLDDSKTHAHIHGESAHNPPSPSQISDAGVEQSSLSPGTHSRVKFDIPLVSTCTHSGTPVSDPKHSEDGFVPPTSGAATGLIPGKGTGRPRVNDPLWEDYVNRAHSRHLELTRSQVESTLITMKKRAMQSNLPFVSPIDELVDLELTSGETPKSPPHAPNPSASDDEVSKEVLLPTNVTHVIDTNVFSSAQLHIKPSSSKPAFEFESSSSTQHDSESTQKLYDDSTNKPGPSVTPESPKHTPQPSNSDNGSPARNRIDPFARLDIQSSVADTMKKVTTLETFVAELNNKIDAKVFEMDSKIDAILKSLSTQSEPSVAEREAQLDQLISIQFKHSIEEVEAKYDALVENYLDTITTMLKVHDDLVPTTNDLIKQTHVRHEKIFKDWRRK
uniref:Uncharacterized protein n=1 Tax=Lactuca sativa TaxID=4236 RepID=A0A9R1XKV8_LACSA|nr:hypothetical protein LSAT_V11C300102220 [Lactuca sativa]